MQTNTGPTEFFEQPWYNLGLWIHNKIVFDRLLVSGGAIGTDIGVSMAESYEMSADGLNLSFKLKPGLKWHDGSDLTVKDVAFSLRLAMKSPQMHALVGNTVSSIVGAEAFADGSTDDVSGIKYNLSLIHI